ncbi:pantothenate kinase [Laspinema olomoucense]|uniref:pantothenate kinase n=1 Tax=Laspinema olomoucense TaxID=3231600 RepID=UPI0021BA8B95|nr:MULTISPECIES: pantothenate kinase [unclassified Laspinema]MCT7975144.1 pantothenate kinase [Laspinema sp. D3d]MCT7990658.1 pantothenate kinase [Laspinema sp. D3a]
MSNSATESGRDARNWLALSIGNSRLHWAWFQGEVCKQVWHSPHLDSAAGEKLIQGWNRGELWSGGLESPGPLGYEAIAPNPPLWIASVVPHQLALWQSYRRFYLITLSDLPLLGLYPTLGIDRALALVGAAREWGWPVLVVDAGTALTLTGADPQGRLVGGAILPGFGLQLQSLTEKTAALPPVTFPETLPPRWALTTSEAIASGVLYGIGAGVRDFIHDWKERFPTSAVVITGGGGELLLKYLQQSAPEMAKQAIAMPDLIFAGICYIKQQQSG